MNRILKKIAILLQLTMLFALSGCSSQSENKNDGDYKGTITVWSWNNELISSGIIEKFNKAYPDININLVSIPNNNSAYSTKLMATLRTGINAPDVFLSEASVVKKICNTDYYENLSEKPYNAESLVNDMVPYTVDLGRNEKDHSLRALTWQATPGGFFYRRSLAKQFFGTDDPDKIKDLISSQEKLIETGKIINEKSNGSVKLLASYDELLNVVLGSRKTGWVKDGKLVIDPVMINYLDYAKSIKDNNIELGVKQWTNEWTDSMDKGTVFGYMLPTWGTNHVLKGNAPNTSGDWAFTSAQTPYYWGGSWVGIYKGSQKKELSYLFVKYIAANKDFLKSYAEDTGDFINNTEVQEEIATSKEGENEFSGNQNLYKSYYELVKDVNGSTLTEYDEKINAIWVNCTDLYVNGSLSKDEAIKKFKNDVKEKYKYIDT